MTEPIDFPPTAAWSHHDPRVGFESVALDRSRDGWTLLGSTTSVEDGRPWHVSHRIAIDHRTVTRHGMPAAAEATLGDEVLQLAAGLLAHVGCGLAALHGTAAAVALTARSQFVSIIASRSVLGIRSVRHGIHQMTQTRWNPREPITRAAPEAGSDPSGAP